MFSPGGKWLTATMQRLGGILGIELALETCRRCADKGASHPQPSNQAAAGQEHRQRQRQRQPSKTGDDGSK
eukprot:SAG22_NODE_146_length_17566_cov_17.597847_2_plen_71_part_00